MNAISDPTTGVREMALDRLHELETRLIAHGLKTVVETTFWKITVSLPATVLAPARTVCVQIADGPTGLAWYWVRDTIEDVEYLCPGVAIAEATERIADELRTAGRR